MRYVVSRVGNISLGGVKGMHGMNGTEHTTDEFTFGCVPLTTQLSDPIVSPGEVSDHVHVVAGGTAFQRTMGVDSARNAKETSCGVTIDKSNYWVPQLYNELQNGSFQLVEYRSTAIYYLNRACNYSVGATSCDASKYPVAPPEGLRMVAGDPDLRSYNDSDLTQRAISHMCIEYDGSSNETNHFPRQPCQTLRSQVFMPSCWDGKNLDIADHKSHMAYPAIGDYNKGVCPKSHPVAIYSIFLEFFFNTAPLGSQQSLVYSMGDGTGYGLHGDFIHGWTDQDALQQAMDTCTGLEGLEDPECSITKTQRRALTPLSQPLDTVEPKNELGQSGPIDSLPGHNPVTGPDDVE
ncbi:DUF1996 domain-containing protein [Aspergillus saccharolyticus JOP 1030-1]|uniref:DUF1996 domain-containing protein n=1 Tax=Aspergillus saccharolyticus JOP 1030-1 TaxID=1450539 RepID=A0A319AD33_9EURO|nr:hypothetical protein BP01DRAFT_400093 [Aspergillus saccharolyticus JOP 1030-1]PYH44782.1 hypothetical protein BP01DRAFT_400093 [Aspergillus saccharolyticus JOP 1030-1]